MEQEPRSKGESLCSNYGNLTPGHDYQSENSSFVAHEVGYNTQNWVCNSFQTTQFQM